MAFICNGVKSLSFHAASPSSDVAELRSTLPPPTGVVLFFALVSVNQPPPSGSWCIERGYDVIELSVTSRQWRSSSPRATVFLRKRVIDQPPKPLVVSLQFACRSRGSFFVLTLLHTLTEGSSTDARAPTLNSHRYPMNRPDFPPQRYLKDCRSFGLPA